MNQIDLNRRHAVITGGAQGIGLSIATRLLASGASVSLWDRDVETLATTLKQLGERDTVLAEKVDVSNPESVTAAVEATGGLHSAIERIVAAAPAQCRDEEIIGPVFVPIPEGERTTMLAIGSGVWRWSDLLPASPTCLSNEPAQCLKAPKVQ